tara:strand:- start:331 stop:768 length:438 start_codon:yes stop_codon:yes gene_type:complete
MTYLSNFVKEVEFKVCLGTLSMTTYATNAVYEISSLTGNFTPNISSGVVTLPAGRYMLEAYPYVNQATTSDTIKFVWQENSSGSYADVGIEGQVQVVGDTIGDRDVALATIDKKSNTNVRLIVKTLTSTGTPTSEGGCIVIWKEE